MMPSTDKVHRITALLIRERDLHFLDHDPRTVSRMVREGALRRLHRGWYVSAEVWAALSPEERHLAQIIVAQSKALSPLLFSHASAAVLLGLPVYGLRASPVHITTGADGAGRSTSGVIRHRLDITDTDIMQVAGIRCTTANRTLFDLARTGHPELAISCADAILSATARTGRSIDHSSWDAWRSEMFSRADSAPGARGVRGLRRIIDLADPRADSVLESVSRLQLHRLGFDVEIQVPVAAPNGSQYYLDFEFLGLRLFGECDGKVKYRDEQMLAGRTPQQTVYEEKRREDWIRGRTRKGLIRWDHGDARTVAALGARLIAFGVPLPPRRW